MSNKYRTEGRPPQSRDSDDEIALLDNHVQAYVVRTSMLQSRLLSNLDTLDAQQRCHERDLSTIEDERDRLKVKLQRYVEFVNSVEAERDDMRDAVIRLIEKVEISNDYSKWPHSQISMSSLADPATKQPSDRQLTNEDDLLSYAASVIKTLSKERDQEKRAHVKTREAADARILELEAMLSRREAELESYVASTGHILPMKDHLSQPIRRTARSLVPKDDPISPEEVISLMNNTTTRNKILETEVNMLTKQLDEVLNRTGPPETLAVRQSSSPPIKRPSRSNARDKKLFESDKLIDLEKQINDLGSKIDAFVTERRVLCETLSLTTPRNEEQLRQVDELLHERLQHAERECHRLRRSESLLRAQLNDTRLDAQEREAELMAKVTTLSLALEQRSIPIEVHETTSAQVQTSPPPPGSTAYNLLDPNDGEVPMELATPLMPTTSLTHLTSPSHVFYLPPLSHPHEPDFSQHPNSDIEQDGHADSFYADPPSIPLPPSPEGLSAWEENSEFTISASAFPLPPPFIPHLSAAFPSRNPISDDPDFQ